MMVNEDYNPADFIKNDSFDAAPIIAGFLRDGWDEKNTGGLVPDVMLTEDNKVADIRKGGKIFVHNTPSTNSPVTLQYRYQNETQYLVLDIRGRPPRVEFNHIVDEAKRIINTHRVDTFNLPGQERLSGRVWIRLARERPHEDTWKGMYRRVLDIEVNWRYRRVRT